MPRAGWRKPSPVAAVKDGLTTMYTYFTDHDVKGQLAELLESKPNLIGDCIELRVGLVFDMQFANSQRVYVGTITKLRQRRNLPAFVCMYDGGEEHTHTEDEIRTALRGEWGVTSRL